MRVTAQKWQMTASPGAASMLCAQSGGSLFRCRNPRPVFLISPTVGETESEISAVFRTSCRKSGGPSTTVATYGRKFRTTAQSVQADRRG